MKKTTVINIGSKRATLPPIRCSSEERAIIYDQAQKAGLSVSAYIRHMCVHGSVIERRPIADIELMTQLRRIGVNLNQYVKVLHVRGRDSAEQMNDVLDELAETLETIRDGF